MGGCGRATLLAPAPAATGSPEPADALSAGAAIPTAMLPSLYATAGIAPHHVDEVDDDALERVEALLALESVVAVGEIGLDYHYDLPRQAQRRLFGRQLEWALGRDLPVVVHSREAAEDVVAMLREYAGGDSAPDAGADRDAAPLRGVIHCFTESGKMAEEVIELGFYLSFAGILTFHNAAELRQTAARVPLEKMLIETDSPFLAPAPHRGHRNEPAYVGEVARALAELHGRPLQEVAAITAANARELFGLQT
ncbi:MAG: TatD family hydrolase [Acidobacteriota bacterium]